MELGTLKRAELTTIWRHESLNFTPWLAENIESLSRALGMDIEVTKREFRVGKFSLDILAKDSATGRIVAIENQLNETDHGHLGQLITYAAGVEAAVVVWIAKSFCEEHRQALDWLNRGEGTTEFFGVVVELLQIDDSKPAVSFRVVASPNMWSREKQKQRDSFVSNSSTRSERYREFFQSLMDDLRENHSFTNSRVAQAQNWVNFASGTAYIVYGAVFTGRAQLRAEIYIDIGTEEQNATILDHLKAQINISNKSIPESIEWELLLGRRACRIAVYRSGTIANSSPETLDEYKSWLIDRLLWLKQHFGPLLPGVTKLVTTASEPDSLDL